LGAGDRVCLGGGGGGASPQTLETLAVEAGTASVYGS
jgi:hypothetical protein